MFYARVSLGTRSEAVNRALTKEALSPRSAALGNRLLFVLRSQQGNEKKENSKHQHKEQEKETHPYDLAPLGHLALRAGHYR